MMMQTTEDITFAHLQYELMRLDMLLHRQLWRIQKMRQKSAETALDSFYISADKAYALLMRPFGEGSEIPDPESATYAQALDNITQQSQQLLADAAARGEQPRLQRLYDLFGLDRFACDVLLASLAPALDSRYEALYGYLHDDLSKKQPSINMLLELLLPPGPGRLLQFSYFADDAPIFRHRLLKRTAEWGPNLLNQALHPDVSLISWLLGHYQPHLDMQAYLSYERDPMPNLNLLQVEQIEELEKTAVSPSVKVFYGADIACQITSARWLAEKTDKPLLRLDLATALLAGFDIQDALRLTLRDGMLLNAIPFISNWDSVLVEDAPPPRLLEWICEYKGQIIISSTKKWQPRFVERERQLYWMDFAIPLYGQRQRLLDQFLLHTDFDDDLDVEGVAGQFSLTTGQLQDVVNTAKDLAGQNGRVIDNKHLFAAARAHSNPRLATLARKITPLHYL